MVHYQFGVNVTKSVLRALKRGSILDDLSARLKSCPSPFVLHVGQWSSQADSRFLHSAVAVAPAAVGMTEFGGAVGWMAQAFDLAALTCGVGAPLLRSLQGREVGNACASGFDHFIRTKSRSTCSIAAHPCKKRKDGAPSAGMVQTNIVKGCHPRPMSEMARLHQQQNPFDAELGLGNRSGRFCA